MKTSTEIYSIAKFIGEEKAIEACAKAGFDAWDFSMFSMARPLPGTVLLQETNHPLASSQYLAFARKLKQIGLDNGIHCNQSHAPFPSSHPKIRSYMKRAIECTAEAGGKICIIHPEILGSVERDLELYYELLPFAHECGVKIATENMWLWDSNKDEALPASCSDAASFTKLIDTANDDFLVACLDIGHAEMRGLNTSAEEMILALGPRLQALHVHDNDQHHDNHQLPGTMNIDFDKVTKALRKINYQGYLTLEFDQYLSTLPKEQLYEGVKTMANVARKLANDAE